MDRKVDYTLNRSNPIADWIEAKLEGTLSGPSDETMEGNHHPRDMPVPVMGIRRDRERPRRRPPGGLGVAVEH